MAQGTTFSSGYVGPTASPYSIPTAGTAIEIDAGSQMRIDNVHIADGGIGSGNSAFQCGLDESNPTGVITGAVASLTFTNSRLDANPAFAAGPSNPDFALRLDSGCSGSTFRNLTAYDGTKANVLQYAGNALAQIHVDSNVTLANAANGPVPLINWGTNTSFGLAGVADYGVYVIGATALSQTVCGIANIACVSTLRNAQGASVNAGQITDTQMRCGNFTNVPNGYLGVELGSGVLNTAVSGTASAGKCAIPPLQLVVLDDPTNSATASLSLCNNSNAPVAGCTGYQGPFATGRFYTQPAVSFGTVSVNGNVLYAVPFLSPASGGPISKLGIDVLNTLPKTCRVGVYNAFNGQPNTLITDGGTLSGTGTLTSATLPTPVQLAPQTLYFLAVGCSGNAMLLGALNNSGAASGPLTGSPTTYADTTTLITATWTFSSGALPMTFANGGTITSAAGLIPNVYAGP